MDEIVFTRETLRRALSGMLDLLDEAARVYDAADDRPAAEALAAVAVGLLGVPAAEYVQAVMDRVESRAEAAGEASSP